MEPLVVVAGHVCLDLIPHFPHAAVDALRPGTLTHVGPARTATGGAVANTGVALHRLGVPVALAGKVGDDLFGGEVLRLLRAHGPALAEGMVTAPGEPTSYSIVVSPPGVDRLFLHCPGANDTFAAGDVDLARFAAARLLHFGYPPIMRRIASDGGAELRGLFAGARRRGLATSLDTCGVDPRSEAGRVDWVAWLGRVLPETDLFVPSLDEVRSMLRLPAAEALPTLDALRGIAGDLLAMGAAVVVLKLGEHGLYLRATRDADRLGGVGGGLLDAAAWAGAECHAPCFRVEVAGTTGSGDCTIAGLLAAVLRDDGPGAALDAACAVGACSVEQPDATSGVPAWPAVAARVAAGWPRHEPPAGWRDVRSTR